ncbi:MAG: hypothetical protein IT289_02375 [Oligoflexia bacterium]|nr:hypothetical protein [Oligoflexia bacterium]
MSRYIFYVAAFITIVGLGFLYQNCGSSQFATLTGDGMIGTAVSSDSLNNENSDVAMALFREEPSPQATKPPLPDPIPGGNILMPGFWGGKGAGANVAQRVTRFKFNCGEGEFEGPFIFGLNGSFFFKGTLTLGPTVDSRRPAFETVAIFKGKIGDGEGVSILPRAPSEMELNVFYAVPGRREVRLLGPFILQSAQEPLIGQCK